MTHTPRFTAKAPDSREMVRRFRKDRCVSVQACDAELRELSARRRRTSHPDLVAEIYDDCDEVLETRTELALAEAADLATQLAREPHM